MFDTALIAALLVVYLCIGWAATCGVDQMMDGERRKRR